MMTVDAKNRLGRTLEMLHHMGYDPVDFSGWYDMYATLCDKGIPDDCVSVGYAFQFANTMKFMIVEITKDCFCAMREATEDDFKA